MDRWAFSQAAAATDFRQPLVASPPWPSVDSVNAPSTPPPGWFPDPAERYQLRFWSGTSWTEHVSADGRALVDPMGPPGTAPATPINAAPEVAASDALATTTPAADKPGFLERRRRKREAARQQAIADDASRDELQSTAIDAALGDTVAMTALPALVATARHLYSDRDFESRAWSAITKAIRVALADDILSADESEHIQRLGEAFGITSVFDEVATRDSELLEELAVAEINDGRLPIEENSPLIPRSGEVAHYSCRVALMKETAVREFRGGSQGVSIRIAKGVNYRVGGVRGRSVVVGTTQTEQDTGDLVITDRRAVFIGGKRTLEFRYDRLIALEQYRDGIRMNVSNRQTASLFIVKSGSPTIAAALISHLAASAER
ncbi:hypothetical protein GCM10027169_24490 [Gordonia jinhuaensis]|uniref:DUF2510 domain-containing protein n=1 Tax=Gordonia jinhuaensis TaxID=1517702 RepID=A0A916WY99_9ACTN|nr:hypothetical protein GCM10011489_29370 [Gordonia jinhuaensis]